MKISNVSFDIYLVDSNSFRVAQLVFLVMVRIYVTLKIRTMKISTREKKYGKAKAKSNKGSF